MTCHLSDAQIWAAIKRMAEITGWETPSVLIDAVAVDEGINAERVRAVYVARTTMQGAG